jgi:DNA-directed RNA polymerase subunit M/transcription elongation factor TFIIS
VSHECPRCGAALSTLSLGAATALACEDCGYADVEADHSGEPALVESWADAIARFEENQ